MQTTNLVLHALAGAAIAACVGTAQAALTIYTTQTSFAAAIAAPGVDTYAGFLVADQTLGPIIRNAGDFTYTATTDRNGFWGAGTLDDPSLSTTYSAAPIVFSGFSPSVNAIGANFYGTDLDGQYVAGDQILIVTDSTGASVTRTLTPTSTASFLGFTTTGRITALVVTSAGNPDSDFYPTVDNLMLAAPVPELGTATLLLAGLAALGGIAWRRKV